MSQTLDETTDVEKYNKELEEKRRVFGVTSNQYGRIIILNKSEYEEMIKKNETMLDENGLNEGFVNLTESESDVIKVFQNAKEKDEKPYNELLVKKVSKLRNFMSKFKNIPKDKMDLPDEVIEKLSKIKVSNDTDISEKDAEIERLQKELEEARKVKKTEVIPNNEDGSKKTETIPNDEEGTKKTTVVPNKSKTDEDDPFKS